MKIKDMYITFLGADGVLLHAQLLHSIARVVGRWTRVFTSIL